MPINLSLIDDAELRGYIKFNDDRSRITYICGRDFTDNFADSEEVVRAFVYSWLIIVKGYPAQRIEVENSFRGRCLTLY